MFSFPGVELLLKVDKTLTEVSIPYASYTYKDDFEFYANISLIRGNITNNNNHNNSMDNIDVLNWLTQCLLVIPLWRDSKSLSSLVDKVRLLTMWSVLKANTI